MSIQRLELTIRVDDAEWTMSTEECLKKGIWSFLAEKYEEDSTFSDLKILQEETEIVRRYYRDIAEDYAFSRHLEKLKEEFGRQP